MFGASLQLDITYNRICVKSTSGKNKHASRFRFTVGTKEPDQQEKYFENTLFIPDNGEEVIIPREEIKNYITEIYSEIDEKFLPLDVNTSSEIYLGNAGIAYMFYTLSKAADDNKQKRLFLNKATTFIKPALNMVVKDLHKVKDGYSFLLGQCGVFAIAAVVFNQLKQECMTSNYFSHYCKIAGICKKSKFLDECDNFSAGRAGYLLGTLWLSRELNQPIKLIDLHEICDTIVKSGKNYAKKNNCNCPLMYSYFKTEYIGALHGLSTILFAILSVPGYLEGNTVCISYVKESIDYILSLQDADGNFPVTTASKKNDLVQFCHGASGVVHLMIKAYLIWKEEKYLDCCRKIAELVWERGLSTKGPGLCHGIAGNGYVFLIMYRVTGENIYLRRAIQFARFLRSEQFKKEAKTPDHPYSLFEGLAGVNCFLVDILQPNVASFPFLEIF